MNKVNLVRPSVCNVNCHKKCERHMPNLCGVDQKLMAETLQQLRTEKSQSIMTNKGGGGGVSTGKIRIPTIIWITYPCQKSEEISSTALP